MSVWTANVLTLFPEMFPGTLGHSLAGRALAAQDWGLSVTDIRDFATDAHRTVDDAPFGGGPGMVMRADVLDAALDSIADAPGPVIYLTPRGRRFDQELAESLAAGAGVTLLCGRFEGIDERLIEARQCLEISVGDFVLSGGEPAAITLIDACVRLLAGVIGDRQSLDEESFQRGLLEYPQYTRPANWRGRAAPAVLLSGHHEKIRAWRLDQAERITRERRPDLWDRYVASAK
jgi:tRNA (guanine37-N1)-methyltransferase